MMVMKRSRAPSPHCPSFHAKWTRRQPGMTTAPCSACVFLASLIRLLTIDLLFFLSDTSEKITKTGFLFFLVFSQSTHFNNSLFFFSCLVNDWKTIAFKKIDQSSIVLTRSKIYNFAFFLWLSTPSLFAQKCVIARTQIKKTVNPQCLPNRK